MRDENDGTGVRMRKEELAGRKGKQEDGSAKTRQAYLGCVFTQHTRDEKGRPIRDHHSTTYLSTFGKVQELGLLLRWEARRQSDQFWKTRANDHAARNDTLSMAT